MSLTKSITAVAVLQMVGRGLLSLDTRVAEVIPEYAQRGKHRVTIHHLLTHTGGIRRRRWWHDELDGRPGAGADRGVPGTEAQPVM